MSSGHSQASAGQRHDTEWSLHGMVVEVSVVLGYPLDNLCEGEFFAFVYRSIFSLVIFLFEYSKVRGFGRF